MIRRGEEGRGSRDGRHWKAMSLAQAEGSPSPTPLCPRYLASCSGPLCLVASVSLSLSLPALLAWLCLFVSVCLSVSFLALQPKDPPWLPRAWNWLLVLGCLSFMEGPRSLDLSAKHGAYICLSGESSRVSSHSHKTPAPRGRKPRLWAGLQASAQRGPGQNPRPQHLPLLAHPHRTPPGQAQSPA